MPRAATLSLLLGLTTLALGSACKRDAAGEPEGGAKQGLAKVDDAAAGRAIDAIASAPADAHGLLAAAALVELEAGRLDAKFLDGWKAIAQAPPEQRRLLAARAISDSLAMLDEACEAEAAAVMQRVAEAPPEQKAALLWTECALERHGLVSADAAKAADPSALILAHMAFAHVQARGGVAAKERELLAMSVAAPPA